MMISPVLAIMSNFTLYLLFVALGIFVWLAWRSHNPNSFRFQISIFILIWIGGEFVTTLYESRLFDFHFELHDVGMQIHLVSMILFASIMLMRYYYSYRSGHKIVESLTSILKQFCQANHSTICLTLSTHREKNLSVNLSTGSMFRSASIIILIFSYFTTIDLKTL